MATVTLPKNKRALLIGNYKYTKEAALNQCQKDAEDIGKRLRNMDFKVTIDCNLNYQAMKNVIKTFEQYIEDGDLVVFFFSGHGIQWNNRNYLIAVDQNSRDISSMHQDNFICVQDVLESIRMNSNPYAAVFLLDCCRSYPDKHKSLEELKPNLQKSSMTTNSKKKEWLGFLLVFACGPSEKAIGISLDGEHSLFTYYLLKYIDKPNLTIDDMMTRVCARIRGDTNGGIFVHQEKTLSIKIYFNGAGEGRRRVQDRGSSEFLKKVLRI